MNKVRKTINNRPQDDQGIQMPRLTRKKVNKLLADAIPILENIQPVRARQKRFQEKTNPKQAVAQQAAAQDMNAKQFQQLIQTKKKQFQKRLAKKTQKLFQQTPPVQKQDINPLLLELLKKPDQTTKQQTPSVAPLQNQASNLLLPNAQDTQKTTQLESSSVQTARKAIAKRQKAQKAVAMLRKIQAETKQRNKLRKQTAANIDTSSVAPLQNQASNFLLPNVQQQQQPSQDQTKKQLCDLLKQKNKSQ